MNRHEIKTTLLLYRPGTSDAADPQIAQALALAQHDVELGRWLDRQCAWQMVLREEFRHIAVPAGLKEQILSEYAAQSKIIFWRPSSILAAAAAVVALLVMIALWFRPLAQDDTIAVYRGRMASVALRGYAMDLQTDDAREIRAYLARRGAPADYVLPSPLLKVSLTGCAIESWNGAKVSMICFRTSRPRAFGQQSDLWLFVVERTAVKGAPNSRQAEVASINGLATATWVQNGRLYLLGTVGDPQEIRRFL